jgi:hypothetical protein
VAPDTRRAARSTSPSQWVDFAEPAGRSARRDVPLEVDCPRLPMDARPDAPSLYEEGQGSGLGSGWGRGVRLGVRRPTCTCSPIASHRGAPSRLVQPKWCAEPGTCAPLPMSKSREHGQVCSADLTRVKP